MKKTILLLMMAACTMAVTAQKKADAKRDSIHATKVADPVDTITIDLVKYRFIKIGEQVHDLKSEVPLFVPFQWIIQSYDFMNSSKSGLSKTEIEQLQSPLLPFWQMYVRQLQAQQQKGQKEK